MVQAANDIYMPNKNVLDRLFRYEEKDGSIWWRKSGIGKSTSKEAGWVVQSTRTSYRQLAITGTCYYAHRIIWVMYYGTPPNGEIDHEDKNGLNNKIENLRDVTTTVNLQNKRKYRVNKSGYTGVQWRKDVQKWAARIRVNYHLIHLGYFSRYEEAVAARQKAEIAYGFHTNHGK